VFIEASRMRGGKQFTMTGHLGEVMQESMPRPHPGCEPNGERYGIDPLLPQAGHPYLRPGAVRKMASAAAMVPAGQPAQRPPSETDAGHDR
jgi:hypothetical protein